MSEPTSQKNQQEIVNQAQADETKVQQPSQTSPKVEVQHQQANTVDHNNGESKKQNEVEDKRTIVEVTTQSKKDIQPPNRQSRQTDRNGQGVVLTQKQLRRMTKIMNHYPVVKEQYEKCRQNYEVLKSEKEQLKGLFESAQNTNTQLNKVIQTSRLQLEASRQQNSQIKQQSQKRKRQNEILIKRLEESKKRVEEAQGMGQKVRQLSMIIDMTTKQVQQHKKIEDKQRIQIQKCKQLLKCQKQLFNNTKIQLDKLRQSEKEVFAMKQQLVRLGTEYKNLKAEKEQLPIMMDKFEHQEQMISQLKDTIQQFEKKVNEGKIMNDKLQKKINQLHDEKKDLEKRYSKVRCEQQQTIGENDALKTELQEQRAEFEVQKRRYLSQIKTLKVELHNEHEKLKITEWQLSQSKKKEKASIKLERVNVMKLSKEDLLNILEEMEMKNQSLKINLDHVAEVIHEKDKKIKDQQASIMTLARQLTKSYPNYHESQGMEYVQKDIIQIGKSKKNDWGEIVEKVMIQNLRLKYSVTALGEQFNHQIRTNKQK